MDDSYDAIVIGAGVIGGCIAHELAKAGRRTLNIDKLPAAGYGSTGSSCAIIRTHYSTLDGAALAHEGYFYWKDWANYIGVADERGLAEYRNTGCLVMKSEQNRHLEPICRNLDALGIPWEDWGPEKILERLPYYDVGAFTPVRRPDDPGFGTSDGGRISGGVFFPLAGYVTDPQLSAHNVQRAAEAHGGTYLFNTKVVDIRRAEGRVAGVRLDDGREIAAPVVVNVAGPHSAIVNAMAGVLDDMNISTRALKQEVCHLPAPPGVDYEGDGMVTSDSDIGVYARPEIGNHILVGSEDPECDVREWVDPDNYDRNFSEQWRVQALRKAQRIPSLPIPEQASGVVDLYDVSDDWIPIYDKSSLPGFYMAVGSSGNQFKNAPVAGQLMAELIAASEAGHDHDADPVNVTLRHTGRVVDLSFCSRRREINLESSFSVLG